MSSKKEKKLSGKASKPFLRQLQLRPHGERLLTSGAAFWLFAACVLVLAMAGAEALAWGYLGYLFGEGWVRWLVAAATGVVIFLVVWMVDVSLITLDRASDEHARRIFSEESSSGWRTSRTIVAVATRIAVVLASLTITAPYLSQLVFHREISQWVDSEATTHIDQGRTELAAVHDAEIAAKEVEIEAKRTKLEAEVAGAGVSGRYGMGPAAQAIEESLNTLEAERQQLMGKKARALEAFEADVQLWSENREAIATKYNISLPKAGILANREALVALRQKPEHQETELAIKAFLAFIFIGLLILKLFEPRSIRYYLSEVLQQEYTRYLAGSFDHLLPEAEWSTKRSGAMTPQRLYDFLVRDWAPNRDDEAKESKIRIRKIRAREDIEALEALVELMTPTVERARQEVRSYQEAWDEAQESYQSLRSAIGLVGSHVAQFDAEYKALQLGNGDQQLDAKGRAEYGSALRSRLGQVQHKLRELELQEEVERGKLERARTALAESETAMVEHVGELRSTEEQIRQARLLMLNGSGSQGSASGPLPMGAQSKAPLVLAS